MSRLPPNMSDNVPLLQSADHAPPVGSPRSRVDSASESEDTNFMPTKTPPKTGIRLIDLDSDVVLSAETELEVPVETSISSSLSRDKAVALGATGGAEKPLDEVQAQSASVLGSFHGVGDSTSRSEAEDQVDSEVIASTPAGQEPPLEWQESSALVDGDVPAESSPATLPPAQPSPSLPNTVGPAAGAGSFSPGGSNRGPPMPMRGDFPADLLEEVPGEPPTTVPMSSQIASQSFPGGFLTNPPPEHHIPQVPGLQAEPVAPLASMPFVPPLRQAGLSASFPRAEAFLGYPPCPPVPPDFDGRDAADLDMARWLVTNRRVEDALRFIDREETPSSVEMSVLRVRCLVALRRPQLASEALARLQEQAGSSVPPVAVPFEMQILKAQLPFMLNPGDSILALENFQELAHSFRRGGKEPTTEVTSSPPLPTLGERLLFLRTLSRIALAAGHGDVATIEFRAAIAQDKEVGGNAEMRFRSLLGRHFLAGGNSPAAAEEFDLAHSAHRDSTTALLDAGYLAVADGNYVAAVSQFSKAAVVGRTSSMTLNWNSAESADIDDAVDELTAAENNLAVSRLYTQELRQSIKSLEAFVRRDPLLFLRPSVAQSLSSLYEFTSDAIDRREKLKDVALALHLEDLDPRILEGVGSV
eukprot:TRINITY_DN40402_c0_g1_i1.p1 TRINITY_DN40402_c0_g1~~TRINITY_DN40402_c0_g1_i1.p1  ORF type:complete len:657 (-),score=109.57 TRINITY_DN40402_c0_g1_i1:102-2033(-)